VQRARGAAAEFRAQTDGKQRDDPRVSTQRPCISARPSACALALEFCVFGLSACACASGGTSAST